MNASKSNKTSAADGKVCPKKRRWFVLKRNYLGIHKVQSADVDARCDGENGRIGRRWIV